MFDYALNLLPRKQSQEPLQINKSKILELINTGTIPARKIAGGFRIEKSDLIDFVKYSPYWK